MMFTIVGQIKDAVRRMIGRRNSAGNGWQVPNVIQLAITPGGLFMGQNISMLHFPETNGLRCVQFMLHHVHDLIEEDIIRIQRKFRRGRMVRILNRGVWIQRVRNLKALRAKMSMLPFEVEHVIICKSFARCSNWRLGSPSSREHLVNVRQHVGDRIPQRHAAARVPHQVGRGEFMHRGAEPARDAVQRGASSQRGWLGGLQCVGCDEC